jgi:hypothetical protein
MLTYKIEEITISMALLVKERATFQTPCHIAVDDKELV